MVEVFDNSMDMLAYNSYLVQAFCYSRKEELIVVIEEYGVWIKATETSVRGKFLGSGSRSIVDTFGKRQPSQLIVLSIMAVDSEVLLMYLNYLFTESICL